MAWVCSGLPTVNGELCTYIVWGALKVQLDGTQYTGTSNTREAFKCEGAHGTIREMVREIKVSLPFA